MLCYIMLTFQKSLQKYKLKDMMDSSTVTQPIN